MAHLLTVRPCAAPFCSAAVAAQTWVCRRHWDMIPPVIQGALLWCRAHPDPREQARARQDALAAIAEHSNAPEQ